MAYNSNKPPAQEGISTFLKDLDKMRPMTSEEWSSLNDTYYHEFNKPYVKEISDASKMKQQTGVESAAELNDKSFEGMHIPTAPYNEVMTALKRWNFNKKGLFIFGKCGRGKTHMMKAFRKSLYERGLLENKRFEFFNMISLVQMMRDFESKRIHKGIEMKTNEFAMAKCLEADILVLDDIGANRATDYEIEVIFKILDQRCESHFPRPVFMTSNLNLKQVKDKFGMRIADRMLQLMTPRELDNGSGKSYRW